MCTLEKRGNIFFLTLTGSGPTDEHRLCHAAVDSILSALSEAARQSGPGCILVTTSQGKFFCNGFDLGGSQSVGEAVERIQGLIDSFRQVVATLLSLPMPTIAAVQGHAVAAGMMLALCHDYILVRADRGVLYMPELEIGLTMPDYAMALGRAKIGSASAMTEIFLGVKKVRGEEAVRMGLALSAHDGEEALCKASVSLGERLGRMKWDGGVYAETRKSLCPEVCGLLGLSRKAIARPKL